MKKTEDTNDKSKALDEMNALDIVTLMNEEDYTVPRAITPCLPLIAEAADTIVSRFKQGGRVCLQLAPAQAAESQSLMPQNSRRHSLLTKAVGPA